MKEERTLGGKLKLKKNLARKYHQTKLEKKSPALTSKGKLAKSRRSLPGKKCHRGTWNKKICLPETNLYVTS